MECRICFISEADGQTQALLDRASAGAYRGDPGCGGPAVSASITLSVCRAFWERNTAAMLADRIRVGERSPHWPDLPIGPTVSVSSFATSPARDAVSRYRKTSSLDFPRLYTAGVTLNPARRAVSPSRRLTTKPACLSRLSTLHSAHFPSWGHSATTAAWPVSTDAGKTDATGISELSVDGAGFGELHANITAAATAGHRMSVFI